AVEGVHHEVQELPGLGLESPRFFIDVYAHKPSPRPVALSPVAPRALPPNLWGWRGGFQGAYRRSVPMKWRDSRPPQ
ncbi:MAG: hypothetical protein ACREX8_20610, partial [Gammaproteobacteria bacterium]